jgi:hypothetical protein
MKLPPISEGYARRWLQCRTCGRVQYYDYVPYSLSNPIMTTACGHGAALRDLGCNVINEREAVEALEATAAASESTIGTPCDAAISEPTRETLKAMTETVVWVA